MKRIIFLFATLFVLTTASAQLEVKLNPVGYLTGNYNVAAEVGINYFWGIEGKIKYFNKDINYFDEFTYRRGSITFEAAGKYYVNPREGMDGFYYGPYVKAKFGEREKEVEGIIQVIDNTRIAVGAMTGMKWVLPSNITFELGLGLGYAVVNNTEGLRIPFLFANLDMTTRVAVGYRF
jgi:hypothetical protein